MPAIRRPSFFQDSVSDIAMKMISRIGMITVALLSSGAASAQEFTAPIDDQALERIAGREDTALIAESHQVATVTDNRVGNNVRTGDVRISDNAFQNLSGLSVISANSGNNVAINSSMNVNVTLTPRP